MSDVLRQVERCDRLLGDHLAAAVQVFGAAALGVIDLPPLEAPGRLVRPQLRAAATLFWCAQVEGAGVPEIVDALAEAMWTGRWAVSFGATADRLMRYRRGGEDRFSRDERKAIYERLFGEGTDFPAHWRALVGDLVEIERAPLDRGIGDVIARVQVTARELAQGLSDRAIGITGFAGREIVAHVREALALLRDPDLARALGGGGAWQIVRQHAPWLLGRPIDPLPALDRAQAGLTLLEWIAARADGLDAVLIGRADPVVRAASRWRASGGA
ncbi:MAG: hypothetical protein KF773_30730 [Deltaproteobacteria bacterium]|nr:hypothetical protein [Deltaproteobacteria bacterium]MCW5807150.1 hypothetical protein [Deltaproteobacteria bacterium]